MQEALDRYERSGVAEKLSDTKQAIARHGNEKQTVLEHKKQLAEQMDEVKAQLTNQQVRKRVIIHRIALDSRFKLF